MPAGLDFLPFPLLAVVTVALGLLSFEAGVWLGRRRARAPEAISDAGLSAITGAVLGLLAFMLAFTFGLAASHFDQRKKLVLDEADAIGTTYLRADVLPEAEASQARELLREYVNARLSLLRGADVAAVRRRSDEIHRLLWTKAVSLSREPSNELVGRLYVPSLNDVISLHGRRVSLALRYRVPGVVWAVLFLLIVSGMAAVGYQTALGGSRRSVPVVLLTAALSLVILLIADLERPTEGFLKGDQQALVELAESLNPSAQGGR